MPNPDNEPQIPKNQSSIVDDRTGLVSRDWYRFFLNLLNKANSGGGGGGSGTVTSVDVSGGSTGLTTSGGPVTTSGTIALSGTLNVAHGGTGATTAAGARANLGAGTVTSVGTGTGLTGGPITSSGTVDFSNASVGAWAATPSSANLAAAVTDETGSGSLVFANGPTLSAPVIDGANPYVQFNNGSAVTLAAGRMWYNGTTGSWNLGMGGGNITQQVGEELFLYGKASAAITDSPLQIIYQTGTVGASGVVTFAPTVSGITNGTLIVGIATESLAVNAFGRVTTFGVVHGVTTDGAAYGETWADGDVIWYNPVTGNPTKNKPTAPNLKVQVGVVISAGPGGSGSFQVEIDHGSVLGGTDSNVELTAVANENLLQYYGAGGYWRNVTPASVTVGNVSGVVAIANGGTGQTTKTDAFDALSPATTKGDLIVYNGTDNVRQAVGADTYVLTADSAQATGVKWAPASGSGLTISNDTTTATNLYPTFANATSGTMSTIYTGNAKLLYKPSTGELTSPAVVASNGIFVNGLTISTSYTIPSGSSGVSAGTITIASGVTVTVSSGSRWVVV